jgi:tRNA dimethylallyltransferase
LYIKALLEGLDDLPVIPEGRREYWQAVHDREGVVGLQKAVMERSPAWFDSMADHANSRRLIRALELLDAGCVVPPRSWMMEKPVTSITGLEMARAELVDRIETRVSAMYAGGLLQEVRTLLDRGWSPTSTAAQAIGYAEAIACLTGTLAETAAMAETARRTRQLAKRQMTWFRHQTRVSWISVAASMTLDDITAKVSSDWDQHGPQPVVLQ